MDCTVSQKQTKIHDFFKQKNIMFVYGLYTLFPNLTICENFSMITKTGIYIMHFNYEVV